MVRFIGVVQGPGTLPPNPPDDGFVSTINGTVTGSPPDFVKFNGTLPPGHNTQAASFSGTVADFFTFADGAFIFRWTNGTVTEFNPDGSVRGMDAVGANAGISFIVGTGPHDPLPGSGVATYTFVRGGGTASTQDGAVSGSHPGTKTIPGGTVGQGITGGTISVDFMALLVGASFQVQHGQIQPPSGPPIPTIYNINGSGIPLDVTNGTFSTFNRGSASASGSSTCSGCQVDIVGSLEGPAVSKLGNAPDGVGIGYRIRDNGPPGPTQGPQNWIKGVGGFGLSAFR